MLTIEQKYNALVEKLRGLNPLTRYRAVGRFKTPELGEMSITQIESALRAVRAADRAHRDGPNRESAMVEAKAAAPKAAKTTKQPKAAAKKAAPAKKAAAGRPAGNGGITIAQITKQFNDLVPRAQKKGIKWAKHHSSSFGSRAGAEAQLKKLADALAG